MYELKIYRGVMCHDNEKWCKIWWEIDLSVQNWLEEFDEFWPEHSKTSKLCTLTDCFWRKYIIFEPKKYRGVMFDGTKDCYKIWRKTDFYFQKIRIWRIFIHRLKNHEFISESNMAELNQNKNSKQPDRPDAVWKLYFTFEINE